ncbi:MAG TPA: hypothetical protein VGF92_09190 [Stellaceae bacterium]|jgi:hypothetical protein
MKSSLLGITLAFGLASGIAAAHAADMSSMQQVAAQPQASATTTEQDSFQAFKSNVNPTFVVPTTGAYYDQEDQFVGTHGYPLGGWKELSSPPS